MIEYRKGDLFMAPEIEVGGVIVPHCVNNIGAWGAGFVLAVNDFSLLPKQSFLAASPMKLGEIDNVCVSSNVYVANMCAQDGITSRSTGYRSSVKDRPLRYDHLVDCMRLVELRASFMDCIIVAPKFCAGLAGGNWEFVEKLIEDIWRGLKVIVYEF